MLMGLLSHKCADNLGLRVSIFAADGRFNVKVGGIWLYLILQALIFVYGKITAKKPRVHLEIEICQLRLTVSLN